MNILGNIVWWLFGGLVSAIGYFTATLSVACTIIGLPFAFQIMKLGMLCLLPFDMDVRSTDCPPAIIRWPLNLIWIIFGGFFAWMTHIMFGVLLYITIIGIPFARQHFKMAALSLAPFGKDVYFK